MSMRIRRGGGPAGGGPPPSQTYGPTNGVQSVRDGTAPQAVTDPGGGVTFTTWADLNTKIGLNPLGTKFVHAQGGVINDVNFQLNTTSKEPKIYFLGVAGSTATVLDGQNESALGITAVNAGNRTEIYGGEWKNLWRGVSMDGTACVLQDAIIHNCYQQAFNFGTGNNTRATRVYAHTNGNYNLQSSAPNSGCVLEYCHVRNGNTRNLPNVASDAGAMKVSTGAHDFTLKFCWFETNNGPGIWFDGSNYNISIFENVSESNVATGIFYELGLGGTTIHHNYIANNAGGFNDFGTANLLLSGANGQGGGSDAQIECNNNLSDGDGTQVQMGIVNHAGHGLSTGAYFHDNDVFDRGATFSRSIGLASTAGTTPLQPSANNVFQSNRYHVKAGQTGAAGFVWGVNQSIDI